MADTGTITIRLGSRQAAAVFGCLVRGTDEWDVELDDESAGGTVTRDELVAANEGIDKLLAAARAKGWDLVARRNAT